MKIKDKSLLHSQDHFNCQISYQFAFRRFFFIFSSFSFAVYLHSLFCRLDRWSYWRRKRSFWHCFLIFWRRQDSNIKQLLWKLLLVHMYIENISSSLRSKSLTIIYQDHNRCYSWRLHRRNWLVITSRKLLLSKFKVSSYENFWFTRVVTNKKYHVVLNALLISNLQYLSNDSSNFLGNID